jgi:hypothetical protein
MREFFIFIQHKVTRNLCRTKNENQVPFNTGARRQASVVADFVSRFYLLCFMPSNPGF